MSLRDILVFLDSGDASEGRLRLAAGIARSHGACLSAVFLHHGQAVDPQPVNSTPRHEAIWGLPIGHATDPPEAQAEANQQRCRERLRSLDLEGEWYEANRADADDLITLAQAADLIVIGQTDPKARSAPALRPDEIVVACGRPVP